MIDLKVTSSFTMTNEERLKQRFAQTEALYPTTHYGENEKIGKLRSPCTIGDYLTPDILNTLTYDPNIKYKTTLCKNFDRDKTCSYGNRCHYAHGINELRVLDCHPFYKTKLCIKYHKIGICELGVKCRYIHDIKIYDEKKIILEQEEFQLTDSKVEWPTLPNIEDHELLLSNTPYLQ